MIIGGAVNASDNRAFLGDNRGVVTMSGNTRKLVGSRDGTSVGDNRANVSRGKNTGLLSGDWINASERSKSRSPESKTSNWRMNVGDNRGHLGRRTTRNSAIEIGSSDESANLVFNEH